MERERRMWMQDRELGLGLKAVYIQYGRRLQNRRSPNPTAGIGSIDVSTLWPRRGFTFSYL
jgi:hypothetical protein